LAGIYLHIPFCRQACNYCNFHFATSLRYKDPVIGAMMKEAELEKDYAPGEPIHTVYFGGGTPSLLHEKDIAQLMNALRHNFPVQPGAEITLEANPDDITADKLQAWKDLGINRLSIGIQSFFEEELRWMNRAHNARQARECIELSLKYGFDNFSIDLIYGSPLLTDEGWRQNVDTATAYGISHLSCYALTVEERTPLHKLVNAEKKTNVDQDKQARQFLLLMQWLGDAGYEHYEVSNFAKPGFRSKHNSSYWRGEKYIGLGPSAHSYNGKERRWNVANNNVYMRSVMENVPERETEDLTSTQRLNEYVMISLRTMEGMDLNVVETQWGTATRQGMEKRLRNFINSNLVLLQGSSVRLTNQGMLMADGIAAELFE
jgi:oxygen-independent coproporphyrinogen-3 oxidase